jgi:hypothetical protein
MPKESHKHKRKKERKAKKNVVVVLRVLTKFRSYLTENGHCLQMEEKRIFMKNVSLECFHMEREEKPSSYQLALPHGRIFFNILQLLFLYA